MPLEYGRFASDVLLRGHLLPYLLPIRSERQLAFALAEKDVLRRSVGLTGTKSPLRGTLWHFRKRNLHLFRKLLVRGLSIIYLEAEARRIPVPFLGDNNCADKNAGVADEFYDRPSDTRIEISDPLLQRLITKDEQLPLPLDIQIPPFIGVTPRLLLPQDIGFPLLVTFKRVQPSTFDARVVFRQPPWLNEPYGHFEVGSYIGKVRTPYTACNIVVTRRVGGRDQILLSRRLQGTGMGSYTLPGGKKHDNETVKACVRRELKEETGLILTKARPISDRITNFPDFPRVRSIGVLAEEVRGEPRRREWHQHSNWEWYDVADLPTPLFFPTEFVLRDFFAKRVRVFTWDDVEDSEDLPLLRKG